VRRIIAGGLAAAGLMLAGCSSTAAAPAAALPGQHAADPSAGAPGERAARSPAGARGQHAAQSSAGAPGRRAAGPPGTQASGVLRLGMAENAADAPALAGWQMGFFGQDLGKVALEPEAFPTSAAETAALEDGQLDAAYLDPVAALQAWQSAPGGLIKIVAGVASGGAELIVAPTITSPALLKGRQLAAPPGSAQQAAADHWLQQHHLPALTTASAPAGTGLLREFRSGKIAGAWEPPPLDIQLTAAGGRVLVNENSLWPGRQFPTAVLVITRKFLAANPLAVTALLKGQLQAGQFLTAEPVSAQAAVRQRLTAIGTSLPAGTLAQSLAQVTFTDSPLPGPLLTEARQAAAAHLLKPLKNLASIYELGPLDKILKAAGQPPASA
jgi:NitT/TauT family transport system substrate-binding protein